MLAFQKLKRSRSVDDQHHEKAQHLSPAALLALLREAEKSLGTA